MAWSSSGLHRPKPGAKAALSTWPMTSAAGRPVTVSAALFHTTMVPKLCSRTLFT